MPDDNELAKFKKFWTRQDYYRRLSVDGCEIDDFDKFNNLPYELWRLILFSRISLAMYHYLNFATPPEPRLKAEDYHTTTQEVL